MLILYEDMLTGRNISTATQTLNGQITNLVIN